MILEKWTDSQERIEREPTEAEAAQMAADAAAAKKAATAAAKAEKAAAEARTAAIEHAKSLGFTDAMIAVMYPTLVAGDATE